MNWLIYLVYIGFFLIIFYGVKQEKITERDDYLRRINLLRGLFALDIIIGHVAGQNMLPLMPFEKFSIISVSAFFFLSGSGLTNSYYRKKDYLKEFPGKIAYLICTTLLLYMIKVIIQFFTHFDLGYIPINKWNIFKIYFEKTNWYIWELILLYIVFWLLYSVINSKIARVIVISITIFIIGLCFSLNGLIEAWYYSILGFPLGVVFSEYFKQVITFIHCRIGKLLIFLFLLCGFVGHVIFKGNTVGSYITRNMFCLACILIIILIIEYVEFNNKILKTFTLLSYELYLYQSLYLDLTNSISSKYVLRMLIVGGCTFLTAFMIYPIDKSIKQICAKMLLRRTQK